MRLKARLLGSEQREQTGERTADVTHALLLPSCGGTGGIALTFHRQDEALLDGHPEGAVGDTADELSPRVLEPSVQVEERRHGVRLVVVVFVAGQQDVGQRLGQRSADPLARRCRVLLIPNDLHVQGVVAICVARDLVVLALLQHQSRPNVDGDTRRL